MSFTPDQLRSKGYERDASGGIQPEPKPLPPAKIHDRTDPRFWRKKP